MATNRELIAKLMGAEKYVLACAHLIALPGSPAYDREGGMKKIIDQALRDTKILLDSGVTSILFVNEADIPYYEHLPIEGVAAFATVGFVFLFIKKLHPWYKKKQIEEYGNLEIIYDKEYGEK